MAEYQDREHFIPLRKSELVASLASDKDLSEEDRGQFKDFCRLIEATFHFEYHRRLEALKDAYAPFDPDADTRTLVSGADAAATNRLDQLFTEFVGLMERANFKRLSQDDIRAAMSSGASDWGVNMDVDFDVFDKMEVFARGDIIGKRTKRRLFKFWIVDERRVPVYQRLVLVMKLKQHKRLGGEVNTGAVYLKLFKDIPKLDLEMLFPGARVQMPGMQQLKLGGSLLGTIGFLFYKILSEVGEMLAGILRGGINPLAYWGPLSLVAGYGYRQYAGYQSTKKSYSHMLTQSLYYQNLDNNNGVITRLLDEAEEQECREAVLAYYFLWRKAGAQGWTSKDLDDYIELELEGRAKIQVDFEVDDALAKLERLGLVERTDSRFRAVPISLALEKLDHAWDNYFKFNNPEKSLA